MGRSDSESSVVEISSEETQFVPQEGDDEVLWTVLYLTAERKGMCGLRLVIVETPAPRTNKYMHRKNSHQEICLGAPKDPSPGLVDHKAIEMPTTAGHSTIAVLNPSDSRSLRTPALKGNLGVDRKSVV